MARLRSGRRGAIPLPRRPAERNHPAKRCQGQRAPPDSVELEFHSRHEQRRCHAVDEHDRHESVESDQSENMRTDDDAQDDLQDHHRHPIADGYLAQERRRDGGEQKPKHRVMDQSRILSANKSPPCAAGVLGLTSSHRAPGGFRRVRSPPTDAHSKRSNLDLPQRAVLLGRVVRSSNVGSDPRTGGTFPGRSRLSSTASAKRPAD